MSEITHTQNLAETKSIKPKLLNRFKGRQLVWRVLLRWKSALDQKKYLIAIFFEIFNPYERVLTALFIK